MLPAQGIAETKELLSTTNELGGFKFDLIGIHPYRKTPESPDLDADAQVLFNMLKDKGYENTPVFWPEGMHYGPYAIPQWGIESARWLPPGCWYYGTLSYDMGWTEKISAAWCARSWLVALKYQDRVKSFCSGQKVNNFIMDLNLTPYASQKISNTLGHLLGDAYFKKDIRFAPYVRTYIFEDSKKRPVAAVWCHHPKVDAGTISAPMAEADFDESLEQVFDLMEVERSFKIGKNGKVSFPISSFPLFLRGEPGSLDKFVKAFENASLISGEGVTPLMLEGKPNSPETIQIKAKNYLSRQFDGTLKVGDEKLALKVPASGTSSVTAKLPLPLSVAKIERENLNIAISSGEKSFSFDLSFRSFVSPKTDSVISIDGKLDDWKNIPAIKFINRYTGRKKKNIKDEDFSGWFKTTWNEKGIYICVEIKDDKFVHKAFAETGKRWSNDCLQIYFDTLCDARSSQQRGYDENDYDYAIFPNSKGDGSVVYRYRTPDPQLGLATQAPRDKTIAEDIPSAFKKTDNGYVYEVFFPAKYLLPIRLEKGYAFGFGLFAADCDDNKAEYSGRVKSALTLAPEGKGCYNKPHLWPVMLLWK
jgi:hypothetical protein